MQDIVINFNSLKKLWDLNQSEAGYVIHSLIAHFEGIEYQSKNDECDEIFDELKNQITKVEGGNKVISKEQKKLDAITNDRKKRQLDAEEVYIYWKYIMKKRAILSSKRKSCIMKRLAEGYTVQDLKDGIDGCSLIPFNMGMNDNQAKYNDIELICRNPEKLDYFIERKHAQSEIDDRFSGILGDDKCVPKTEQDLLEPSKD